MMDKENAIKSYMKAKNDIDRWFLLYCVDTIPVCRTEDIVECIHCIGKAFMLALILENNFGEDTKEERRSMRKIKNYLESLITVIE